MWAWIKAVFAALAGLLPAILAEWLAFGLAGAGHGWVAPFFYGLILFLAYPATFVVLAIRRRRRLLCSVLLGTGLVADAALAVHTIAAERIYFEHLYAVEPGFTLLWILLWLGWQAAALTALVANLLATDPEWE